MEDETKAIELVRTRALAAHATAVVSSLMLAELLALLEASGAISGSDRQGLFVRVESCLADMPAEDREVAGLARTLLRAMAAGMAPGQMH